ncbi:MAG: metal-dependent hydrolase [Phycisphaerae bacterium]
MIGHTFVGLATAMATRPPVRRRATSALWTPIVVGLAYLPDIVHQAGLLIGVADLRVVTHSILFAVVASVPLSWSLVKIAAIRPRGGYLISVLSILGHDALDLLQATDRRPLWPLSGQPIGLELNLIPVNSYQEAAVFGGMFCLFAVSWRLARHGRRHTSVTRRTDPRRDADPPVASAHYVASGRDRSAHGAASVWIGRVLVALVVVAASVTHYLRSVRQLDLERARGLVVDRDFQDALATIDRADHWPSTAHPGRLDYLRAEAYLGLGDRRLAERYYRRSVEANPSYFWALADLVVFYASSPGPPEARRRRMSPYLVRLQARFADHRALPRILAKIQRRIEHGERN